MITIFFVDRFVSYSTNLYMKIQKIIENENKYKISFIGPKEKDILFSTKSVKNGKRVWGYGHYFKDLLFYIKNQKPDLVHFSFEWLTYGSLRSVIWFPFLLFLIRIMNVKIVLTLHSLLAYKQNSKWKVIHYESLKIPYSLLKFSEKIFIKLVCMISHKVIVNTSIGKVSLIDYYHVSNRKIEVSNLGVVAQQQNIQEQEKFLRFFKNKKIILYFGVVSPRKNQKIAIEAFNRIKDIIPDYVLVIAGKSYEEFTQYEVELKNYVKNNELQNRVIFLGHIKDSEIDSLFSIAEIALFMYVPMVGATYALTYAIQYNTASIVSDIEMFHETLGSKDALFVMPDDVKSLSDEMCRLAKNDELRNEFKANIGSLVKKFTWEKVAEQHFKIYQNILKEKN